MTHCLLLFTLCPSKQMALPTQQIKQILIKHAVKALLTSSPRWTCANTWSHQTWSWKTTHNIWWTFCQESWPLSFSLLLFVCFLFLLLYNHSTGSCHAGLCLTVCERTRRGGTEVLTKLSTSVCWGQINCVNMCVAMCVSTLSSFCAVVF